MTTNAIARLARRFNPTDKRDGKGTQGRNAIILLAAWFEARLRALPGICLLALLLIPSGVRAAEGEKPFLHPLFADHVVLQRGMTIPVWGWTKPGATVTVTLRKTGAAGRWFFGLIKNGRQFSQDTAVAGSDGKWMARLPALSAGGPYEMRVSGPAEATVSDVQIGDVWICSGQSNMEMGIKMVNNATQEVASANYPLIRLFTVPRRALNRPVETVGGQWLVCSPETIVKGQWNGFSAAAYFFGRDLYEDLHVPIGLIHTSWGGTVAEAWTSAETLMNLSDFAGPVGTVQKIDPSQASNKNPNTVTVLYNGMIAPLEPFAIRGAIWYQGESNASRARQYQSLLPAMIEDWRRRFAVGEFPFLIVQLANFNASRRETPGPSESAWAELREAQGIAARRAGHSALALAIDIGDPKDIHPKNKQEVGRRLALAARGVAYRERVVYSGPEFKSAATKGKSIVLAFEGARGLRAPEGETLKGFAIAGEDKKFVWAEAVINGKTVVVSAAAVEHPAFVRYDWADNPSGNLYNESGLPAIPFRTDRSQ
jgi:sialate O-acetylesterase